MLYSPILPNPCAIAVAVISVWQRACWKKQAWRRDRFLLLNVSTCDDNVRKANELRCIPSLPCRIRSRLVPSSLVMVSVDCISSAGGGVFIHQLGNEIMQIKLLSFSLHYLSANKILCSRCAFACSWITYDLWARLHTVKIQETTFGAVTTVTQKRVCYRTRSEWTDAGYRAIARLSQSLRLHQAPKGVVFVWGVFCT